MRMPIRNTTKSPSICAAILCGITLGIVSLPNSRTPDLFRRFGAYTTPTSEVAVVQKVREVRGVLVLMVLLVAGSTQAFAQSLGQRVYVQRCAGCHDQTTQRTPPKSVLQT